MTAHRLLLLRHAKSSWSDEGSPDVERPLNRRGERDATALGTWLVANVATPDLVLCSAAVRARQTWERAAAAYGRPARLRIDMRLYGASPTGLRAVLAELAEECSDVLVVAHNPGLHELAVELTGGAARELAEFPTAALAELDSDSAWTDLGFGAAVLRRMSTPRTR